MAHLFLSTLSLRRATLLLALLICPPRDFYPRSPCGERPVVHQSDDHNDYISIHALLAESDSVSVSGVSVLLISIHALLAESDFPPLPASRRPPHFYPRSPCGERPVPGQLLLRQVQISIHALLAESDSKSAQNSGALLRI